MISFNGQFIDKNFYNWFYHTFNLAIKKREKRSLMNLILTTFDNLKGPNIYLIVPDQMLDDILKRKVADFLNLDLGKGFFELNLVEESLKTFNLYIEIPSSVARGGEEMALISLITEKNYKGSLFLDLLKNLHQNMLSIPDIYKGFHKGDSTFKDDLEVQEKYNVLNTIFNDCFKELKERVESSSIGNILILGINKVGKTSLINQLKNKRFNRNTKPTLAITLMELLIDSYFFKIIDVGGQKMLRSQWWSYTTAPDAVVFVFDVNDEGVRLDDTIDEFNKIISKISEKKEKTPILLCGNKIDLAEDAKLDKFKNLLIPEGLDLKYKIQLMSAVTGEGIQEGFKWLVKQFMDIS